MKAVFLLILNNSIATVPVILLVLLMHFFLKKIPKKFMLLIWAVAAIRLSHGSAHPYEIIPA